MGDELELMTKYLVQLQFYSEEEDLLYSRDKKHSLSIPGIHPVVTTFENVFKIHLELIRKKQFRAFLEAVARDIPFDIEMVLQNFNENACEIGSQNLTDELSANFLIGPIRAAIQLREFDECVYEVKKKALQRMKKEDAKELIEERISDLFQRNDSTVSMLHNLALLKYLTKIFGTDESRRRVNSIFNSYCEELISKLIV